MKIIALILLSVSFTSLASNREDIRDLLISGHYPIHDWKEAKQHLFQNVYLEQDNEGYFVKDVYCNIKVRNSVGPNSMPNGSIINIEHTWPQSKFPRRRSIVQKSDLHHLFPSDTKVNNKRANFIFSDLPRGHRLGERCPYSKIGYNREVREDSFEPPIEHKGNVARALFYFAVRYNAPINDVEEMFLRLWHLSDPVDESEMRRNDIIESIQGNRNIFIDEPLRVNQITDF